MTKTWNGLIVFLGTQDLEKTDDFYAGLLGLELERDQGACRIYKVPGGGHLGFCTHIPVTKSQRCPIITLVADDIDEIYQRLDLAGLSMEHEPRENSRFKIYHFFVTDPNGYLVEVQRFLD